MINIVKYDTYLHCGYVTIHYKDKIFKQIEAIIYKYHLGYEWDNNISSIIR